MSQFREKKSTKPNQRFIKGEDSNGPDKIFELNVGFLFSTWRSNQLHAGCLNY